jgi:hypothetical protein
VASNHRELISIARGESAQARSFPFDLPPAARIFAQHRILHRRYLLREAFAFQQFCLCSPSVLRNAWKAVLIFCLIAVCCRLKPVYS